MALSQQTSLTFLNAKTQVAEQASKQNTSAYLDRAGRSVQQAVKFWNRHNWRWLASQTAGLTASAGATSLPMPFDLRDVYSLRCESAGRQHFLQHITRRRYDRQQMDQTIRDEASTYDLFHQWNSTAPILHIAPALEAASTFDLKYYRRMTIPCAITAAVGALGGGEQNIIATPPTLAGATIGSLVWASGAASGVFSPLTQLKSISQNIEVGGQPRYTFELTELTQIGASAVTANVGGDHVLLDIPEDFENGILTWATHHFLSSIGAPEGRLRYFITLAEEELARALKANEDAEDRDVSFELGEPDAWRPWPGGYV